MELVLEQTQQGTSYEVSVSAEGVEELKRKVKIMGEKKVAILTLRQKPERFDTLAGNPIKEIILKLNLPDHRSILTDSKMEVKRRSVKVKELQERCNIKAFQVDKSRKIVFRNDQFALILGYGDLVQGNVTIKRVYYVECLNHNLFSVGQLLSHLNFDTINLLFKNDIVNGLPKLKYVKDQLCSSCELGKAKRRLLQKKFYNSLGSAPNHFSVAWVRLGVQEALKEGIKDPAAKRKKSIPRKSSRKRQKLEEDAETDELKGFLDIVPREEAPIEAESLSTKFPIVDWKTYVLTKTFMYYQVFRRD
ncbi:integrase, catalytic region, zinc finger, CCHC-type containing protein [Tanacetum coccineum]